MYLRQCLYPEEFYRDDIDLGPSARFVGLCSLHSPAVTEPQRQGHVRTSHSIYETQPVWILTSSSSLANQTGAQYPEKETKNKI